MYLGSSNPKNRNVLGLTGQMPTMTQAHWQQRYHVLDIRNEVNVKRPLHLSIQIDGNAKSIIIITSVLNAVPELRIAMRSKGLHCFGLVNLHCIEC